MFTVEDLRGDRRAGYVEVFSVAVDKRPQQPDFISIVINITKPRAVTLS